jgi:hypothetical protein
MKNITLLATLVIIAFVNKINAQSTAIATATATIVNPISISKNLDINFGNIATNGSASTVVMDTNGVRTAGTGVTIPAGSVSQAAKFEVTGEGGYTYDLTMPETITISNSDLIPASMIVNSFTNNSNKQLVNGTEVFNVGATLNIKESQPVGTYTNPTGFNVSVNYN